MDILVCTALYPAVLPYLAAYTRALRSAVDTATSRVEVLFALDGVEAPEELTALGDLPRHFVPATGAGAPGVRSLLMRQAVVQEAPTIVFTDADDMLEPTALLLHAEALARADFSYGDQIPVSAEGDILEASFFAGKNVPQQLSTAAALLRRNFVGFTGSAVRTDRITADAACIPGTVGAADWWFYTMMLRAGRIGQQTKAPVVRYRQHGNNVLGPYPNPTISAFLQRCRIALAHYRSLPQDEAVDACARSVSTLLVAIQREPDAWAGDIVEACKPAGVWFEDIWRLITHRSVSSANA